MKLVTLGWSVTIGGGIGFILSILTFYVSDRMAENIIDSRLHHILEHRNYPFIDSLERAIYFMQWSAICMIISGVALIVGAILLLVSTLYGEENDE
jgi:hypothetical protein